MGRCQVISQFLNMLSLLPFTYIGGYLILFEVLKLEKTGFGFEFALFFKHIFSFSFKIGMEFAVDLLQVLFSVTFFVDVMTGIAGLFAKQHWKQEICILSYFVGDVKNIAANEQKPAKTNAADA